MTYIYINDRWQRTKPKILSWIQIIMNQIVWPSTVDTSKMNVEKMVSAFLNAL